MPNAQMMKNQSYLMECQSTESDRVVSFLTDDRKKVLDYTAKGLGIQLDHPNLSWWNVFLTAASPQKNFNSEQLILLGQSLRLATAVDPKATPEDVRLPAYIAARLARVGRLSDYVIRAKTINQKPLVLVAKKGTLQDYLPFDSFLLLWQPLARQLFESKALGLEQVNPYEKYWGLTLIELYQQLVELNPQREEQQVEFVLLRFLEGVPFEAIYPPHLVCYDSDKLP